MTILLLLIPLGLLLLGVAVAAFVWAANNDQFEDLEAEGGRILFEEDGPPRPRRATPARRDDEGLTEGIE